MSAYRPYPKYKDSGVEWVGQIPAHWSEAPTFAKVCESKTKNGHGLEDNVLSLSYGNIVRRNVDDNFGLLPESFNTYQIVKSGDVILRLTDLQNDKRSLRVGLAKESGIITSAYLNLRAKSEVDSSYLYRLLHSYDTTKVFYGMGGGLRQSMKFEDFRRLPLILPPLPEQIQIASFLDRECGKLDALQAKQERLIELLKEKRQALISHAVTQGLDPNAQLKPSGIEWLGDVPEGWATPQLKFLIVGIDQGKSPECEARTAEPDEWGVMKSGCVNWGIFREEEHKALPPHIAPIPTTEIRKGDLLMSRASGSTDLIGSVAYVENVRPRLLLSDKIFRLKVSKACDPRFIWRMASTIPVRRQIELSINGAEGLANNITKESIRSLFFTLPPLAEQRAIVAHLDEKCGKIDRLIAKAEHAIALLKERRSALISAAVTGKIDVRNA